MKNCILLELYTDAHHIFEPPHCVCTSSATGETWFSSVFQVLAIFICYVSPYQYNPGYCDVPGAPPSPPNRLCMFHCTGPDGSYDDGWLSLTFAPSASLILFCRIYTSRCGGAQIAGQKCDYPIDNHLACFRPGSSLTWIPYETFYTCDFDACLNYINTAPMYAGSARAQGWTSFDSAQITSRP